MSIRGTHVRVIGAALFAVLLLGAMPAYAQTASPNEHTSGELVEEPKRFDGTEVEFKGEVIGEVMVRGENAWIHINDDAYYLKNVEEGAKLGGLNSGMAVYLPARLTDPIAYYGDYKHEGDIVTIKGTFNAACAQHGGDMDIHAQELNVNVPGHTVVDQVMPWKLALAAAMALLAGVLFTLHRRTEISRALGVSSHRR